jgi:hypothetical protein
MKCAASGGALIALCLAVAPASGRSDATNPPATAANSWPSITSHQRNFIVTDMPKRDAFEIAVWAESVRERLSEWAGAPIPGERSYPIVMSALLRTNEPTGRVLKAQDVTEDGFLRQEITMINPAAMDQEDVLEAVCWLLLNRWIQLRQPAAERTKNPGAYPDWFAVGVAQNLYPELRERNHREVREREASGDRATAVAVFEHVYLPPGRWPEKARAGLVTAWLAETLTPTELLGKTSVHIADGGKLDAETIARLINASGVRSVNMGWDVWMARMDKRLIPGVMSFDISGVTRVLELRPEQFGVVLPSPLPGGRLTAEMLIADRAYEWVHHYSRAAAWRLRQEAVGKSPELVAAINRFVVFFDALAEPGESAKTKKKKVRSARWLQTAWDDASAAWTVYLANRQQHEALLDRFGDPVQQVLQRWEVGE